MEIQTNQFFALNALNEAVDQQDIASVNMLAPKIMMSHELFSGQRELIIQHMGQSYRLRQTQQGKLILTK
jgi:hemin uptake protein HemP